MPRLNLKTIEGRVGPLGGRDHYEREFIFDLLAAYGRSPASITRLRSGALNVADDPDTEVAQKGVVYFKPTTDDLYAVIDDLRTAPTVVRYGTRFVLVTDYVDLLAVDTRTGETLAIPLQDIDKQFTFFLPWAGMEKAQYVAEAHADVKAAERMAKLFDQLLVVNPDLETIELGRHALNVFFSRLLFCFFAEDTGIFEPAGLFTDAVAALTQPDGSDLAELLNDLFRALDTPGPADKPSHLARFPYVNGRLFTVQDHHLVPTFDKRARDLLLESGRLLWNEINPDIFGSMFQAVVSPDQRADLGQHYTSVPNILKTIEPLFLNALREELDLAFDSPAALEALLRRVSQIKVFDPACGSGNFLVIAYKELRRLEHAILERLAQLDSRHQTLFAESQINVENFSGIELDDFAAEVAILSLWIAKHQMNQEFLEKFNIDLPLIPLKETGRVTHGNAARIDWGKVCPNGGNDEIYLIGNPPYKGARELTPEMKADFAIAFSSSAYSKNLDYIAIWFLKGAEYVAGTRAELAFVTTNSIGQGEQVGLLFPVILGLNVEIGFTHTSFKWDNNARGNAGVTVAVISLRPVRTGPKYIFAGGLRIEARNINGYLVDGPDLAVTKRTRPSRAIPEVLLGNMPNDGGHLTFDQRARDELLRDDRTLGRFVKRFVGAAELIRGKDRYAVWVEEGTEQDASSIPEIAARFDEVRDLREKSKRASTKKLADTPWRFGEVRHKGSEAIVIPRHSSENRKYIPMGYVGPEVIVGDSALMVCDASLWLFGVLTSRMHMVWTRAVAGRLKTDLRYSATIVYNNFPVPALGDAAKERLAAAALRVLDVREYHSELTLADLYDPEAMPDDLRAAHSELDAVVDAIYRRRPFDTDEERLSHLFGLYEQMTAEENRA
ncbi:DNA methyltransferase [Curtobacterium sp. Leaf261]|uniref:DNA methyltransferase n=1 Tax=Curtobacterium sp. Leaf261 TaxID=1736311 RepID=UPI0006F35D01|nr:DNA methyltransferase [Curtobacterium sp. Leaf261]KQO64230.1 DNA methyltransferase [Curtobacterium sp. Leaf261]